MQLLIVRHAIAEDKEQFAKSGKPDSERPLTRDGREKMRSAARALAVLFPTVDVVASSPYRRTLQTARIFAEAYDDVELLPLDSLAPGESHDGTVEWLAKHANLRGVAMVGHEPSLSALFHRLVSGHGEPFFEFRKGGAALLSFTKKPADGGAKLEWAIPPAALRMIAKSIRG